MTAVRTTKKIWWMKTKFYPLFCMDVKLVPHIKVRIPYTVRKFENRVLKRIFILKRNKATGGWRKLHDEMSILCAVRRKLSG
jgi:hypothetical protein